MNTPHALRHLSLPVQALLLALPLCMATPAPAQARERLTQWQGPKGQVATRQVQRSQGDVSSTRTGPQGKTFARSVDRSASGSTATVTGPNGQTATRSTTVTHGNTSGSGSTDSGSTAP